MNKIYFSIFLLPFLFATQIKAQTKEQLTIIVADKKVSCDFEGVIMACYEVKVHKDSMWMNFPYLIKGFLFEMGTETEMIIEEHDDTLYNNEIKVAYKLVKIIKKTSTIITDVRVLMNNKWQIINGVKEMKNIQLRKAKPFITLDTNMKKLEGFAGCNEFISNVTLQDGVINFGTTETTQKTCDNFYSEDIILKSMEGKAAFYVRNNMLFIICQNGTTLHLRPTKKLDSIITIINTELVTSASVFKGNTFFQLNETKIQIRLDELVNYGNKMMIFNNEKIPANLSNQLLFFLKNMDANNEIVSISILNTPLKERDMFYANIKFKNGTEKKLKIKKV